MTKSAIKYVVLLFVLILVGLGGYLLGKKTINPLPVITNQSNLKISPLFSAQSAVVVGTITKVDTFSITIRDDKMRSDTFPMAPRFTVSTIKNTPTVSTASADIKSIQINKKVLLNLQVIDGQFKVVDVTYYPEIIITNPSASSSGEHK